MKIYLEREEEWVLIESEWGHPFDVPDALVERWRAAYRELTQADEAIVKHCVDTKQGRP
jgi:hypothetical protein